MNIKDHLKGRNLDTSLYNGICVNEDNQSATFMLWNLSGQLCGFQAYKPNATKKRIIPLSNMRYYTITGKVDKKTHICAFGVELLDHTKKQCYIAEGVFDVSPLHLLGVNAIAVLANRPKHLYSWLRSLGYELIALCDGDSGGAKLAHMADKVIHLPKGKDPGDMSLEWFKEITKNYK